MIGVRSAGGDAKHDGPWRYTTIVDLTLSVVVNELQDMPHPFPYFLGGGQDLILRQLEPRLAFSSRPQLDRVSVIRAENLEHVVRAVPRRRVQRTTRRARLVLGAVDLLHRAGKFPA